MVLCFEESRNRVGDGSFPAWDRGQGWSPEAACTWVVTQGITLERSLCPNTDRPPHLFHLSIHSFYTYWVSIMCHVPGSPLLLVTPPEPRPAMTHPSKLFKKHIIFFIIIMIFSSVTMKRGTNTDKWLVIFKVNYSTPTVVFSFSLTDFLEQF